VLLGEVAEKQGLALAECLRDAGLRIECNCGGGGLKAQLKRADRSAAHYALLLGEEEARNGSVTVKDLRGSEAQVPVAQNALTDFLKQRTGRGEKS
jgi:histidyl-tRNA synthetase